MLKVLYSVFIVCSVVLGQAQTGQVFPEMHGSSLDDKSVKVPARNGKYTVLAIAFHRGAEEELKTWLKPLYNTFIKEEGEKNAFDVADVYDVNFVFVPLISGFKKAADEFKAKSDKPYWPYVLDTEKTDFKELQKQLGITDPKTPYFFVLDENGKILVRQQGAYSPNKLEKLEEVIE